ncbi:hypothetical protein [Bradyrhizobium barranii]
MAYYQAEQVKALLQEWDRVEETDPRILAYILGSISYDSADFTRSSENFSYSAVSQLPQKWRDRIDENNARLVAADQSPVDVNSLLNHPKELANFMLAYEGNDFGNQPGTDDGWLFRPRGMYQLVGREQYQEAQDQMQRLGELQGLDLLTLPDALWDAKISAMVTLLLPTSDCTGIRTAGYLHPTTAERCSSCSRIARTTGQPCARCKRIWRIQATPRGSMHVVRCSSRVSRKRCIRPN